MKRALARHMIRTAFRTTRELADLLALLKQHSSAEEYRGQAARIAAAIDGINTAVLNPTLTSHPELVSEVEADLETYGKFL